MICSNKFMFSFFCFKKVILVSLIIIWRGGDLKASSGLRNSGYLPKLLIGNPHKPCWHPLCWYCRETDAPFCPIKSPNPIKLSVHSLYFPGKTTTMQTIALQLFWLKELFCFWRCLSAFYYLHISWPEQRPFNIVLILFFNIVQYCSTTYSLTGKVQRCPTPRPPVELWKFLDFCPLISIRKGLLLKIKLTSLAVV